MRFLRFRTTLSAVALLSSLPFAASGQQGGVPIRCTGQRVDRIEIQPLPPPFSGAAKKWRTLAHAIGLHHATTRPGTSDRARSVCTALVMSARAWSAA